MTCKLDLDSGCIPRSRFYETVLPKRCRIVAPIGAACRERFAKSDRSNYYTGKATTETPWALSRKHFYKWPHTPRTVAPEAKASGRLQELQK
jgi:hypothetical protein